jgi:histone deacetylase HOS3
MAYVRLGERHCEGKHPIHPFLDPKTLPGIPFRIHKTTRKVAISSSAVTNVHGSKWMEELKIMCDSAQEKLASNGNELRRPELSRASDAEPPQHLHQGDLYLCSESLNAFEGALGAVCEAVDIVFSTSSHKRAFVAVRPPGHHCSASFPSGFCWVNNVHIGIMHGILNHGLTHAAIIDFDLHHGDGSQAIAWQHNKRGLAKNAATWKKTSIGYFSIHDINSYPCEYGDEEKVKNASLCIDNAHGQNMWNVHLHEWKSDVEFWSLYQSKYSIILEKTRNYLRLQTERFRASGQVPKAAIFLSAGFDASEWEGAGMQRHKVNVPTEFYARLTRDVVRIASEEGLSVEGRVISVLEGGYSDRALYSGVLSHLSGLAGFDSKTPQEEGTNGIGHNIGNRTESFSRRSTLNEIDLKSLKAFEFPYDPNWWSATELDLFDTVRTAAPSLEFKKPRNIAPGNYSSPTQSSNAKMTEAAKIRRSISNLSASPTIIVPRSPTPPPPDVPWTAAAHELSRLLIPNNRQIDSCKHSELNTEATKARKDRQSLQTAASDAAGDVPAAPAAPTRMSLRERKPVSYLDDDDYQSRRKTVGGPAVLATPKVRLLFQCYDPCSYRHSGLRSRYSVADRCKTAAAAK